MMNVVPSGEKPKARISSLSLTTSGWRPGAETVTPSPDARACQPSAVAPGSWPPARPQTRIHVPSSGPIPRAALRAASNRLRFLAGP
jgi:hypothetical protein